MLMEKYSCPKLICLNLSELLIWAGEERLYLILELFCAGQQVIIHILFLVIMQGILKCLRIL